MPWLQLWRFFGEDPGRSCSRASKAPEHIRMLAEPLTWLQVRGINRTDVLTLGGTFQTAAGIMQASMEDLSLCPGIGPTKIRRSGHTLALMACIVL